MVWGIEEREEKRKKGRKEGNISKKSKKKKKEGKHPYFVSLFNIGRFDLQKKS